MHAHAHTFIYEWGESGESTSLSPEGRRWGHDGILIIFISLFCNVYVFSFKHVFLSYFGKTKGYNENGRRAGA